ncbi:MAG TPA: hypothetical protein VFM14_03260 [Gemmatimonadales bacterium]|nr:hypothetical protein [Gemmatimonadales bacterium]
MMQPLVQRPSIDQPYIFALDVGGKDRVFTGSTDSGRASLHHSADARTANPPAGFKHALLDPRSQNNSPSIRTAIHSDDTVYAAYFSWHQVPVTKAAVVVARDNASGTGGAPFTALTDGADGLPGIRVEKSVPIPWFDFLGQQRVGSALSIAVDPMDSATVYVAWGEGPKRGSVQTLRVRRSTNRGATWSKNRLSVSNATNPALAITDAGKVGLLYQRLVANQGQPRWQTHLRITSDGWATKPGLDIVLADTPEDAPTYKFDPYIGDYADLEAVGQDFFGVFSAHNMPDPANFPYGVVYQRNHDFGRRLLLDVDQQTIVPESIDPFFFHLSQL